MSTYPTDPVDHAHASLAAADGDLASAIAGLEAIRSALRTQDPERAGTAVAAVPSYTVPASAYTALRTLRSRMGGRLTQRDQRCDDCLSLLAGGLCPSCSGVAL